MIEASGLAKVEWHIAEAEYLGDRDSGRWTDVEGMKGACERGCVSVPTDILHNSKDHPGIKMPRRPSISSYIWQIIE